jgi:hypothetical protein
LRGMQTQQGGGDDQSSKFKLNHHRGLALLTRPDTAAF